MTRPKQAAALAAASFRLKPHLLTLHAVSFRLAYHIIIRRSMCASAGDDFSKREAMPLYEVNNKRPVFGQGTRVAPSAEIVGDVVIGKNCYVGFGTIIRGDLGKIIIGDEALVEEGVVIHSASLNRI